MENLHIQLWLQSLDIEGFKDLCIESCSTLLDNLEVVNSQIRPYTTWTCGYMCSNSRVIFITQVFPYPLLQVPIRLSNIGQIWIAHTINPVYDTRRQS